MTDDYSSKEKIVTPEELEFIKKHTEDVTLVFQYNFNKPIDILTSYTNITELIFLVNDYDLPTILATTILAATFVVVANLLVDILYAYIDPRVRVA